MNIDDQKQEFAIMISEQIRLNKLNSKLTAAIKELAIELVGLNDEDYIEKLKTWDDIKQEILDKYPIY